MKLRRLPEDFQVDEQTRLTPDHGPFAFYRLTKTSLGTPEAISRIVERWRIHRKRISYGGLKDRHAVTTQHLTIHNGPRKSLKQKFFELEYLGQVQVPFTSALINGNRFQLVLRDMDRGELTRAVQSIEQVRATGVPNYFDDQRFGSLGVSGEWIAKAWCLGDWERALWLALADPHPHDSAAEKSQKQLLRDLWGDWLKCQQMLARSNRRSIVTYIADKVRVGRPADFRGALARLSVDLRGLYLSAWQSALWNRVLTRLQEKYCDAETLSVFKLLGGRCVFPVMLSKDSLQLLHNTHIPLPCARIDLPEGLQGELLQEVLSEEQIELRQIRVKYPRDSFFSKGLRAAFIRPRDLTEAQSDDDLYPGRHKLKLTFELPRGSYATILVKRLTSEAFEFDE